MKKDVAASAEKNEIVVYQPEGGEFHIEVRVENESVWLTQAQMAELFHATKQNICLHIANIYKEGELDRNSVVKEYLTTASDGTRLTDSMMSDFRAARPDVELGDVCATGKVFHDRYIYLDFGTDSEKLFHCGASSKDAGNKITTIMQLEDIAVYRPLFEKLLQDEK